ncbi:MAG: TIGR00366 family protein [Phycisphaerales bacterium]|jgi:short-chain fatty acids transporter
MIASLGLLLSRTIGRFMPDPFLLAILLSIVAATLAATLGTAGVDGGPPPGPELLASWWTQGVWGLLAFSMQMCLILVTGSAVAESPIVSRGLARIAAFPTSMTSAAALVAAVAIAAGLLNWGLGLVVGAILARETARSLVERGIACHYPLLAACGYLAMIVWHGGFSGSAPLSMTTVAGASKVIPAEVLARLAAMDGAALGADGTLPLSQTLLSPLNLVATGGLAIGLPLLMAALAPREAKAMVSPRNLGIELGHGRSAERDGSTAAPEEAGLLSRSLAILLGVAFVGGFLQWAMRDGLGRLGLDQVNAFMLGAGLLLHGSALAYARAVERAARGCAGIMIQFPLYAGILGLLRESGLLAEFATSIAQRADESTLPLLTLLSAGLVNLFVPSGGGQWAVQGPIALAAGAEAGVAPGTMTMAVAYGDQLTNMLQPFWALPLLAITGVKARDLVGYTALAMVAALAWLLLVLFVLG